MLSCVGTGLAIGRSPIQGALPQRLNGFIVSEFYSDSDQARGANPHLWTVCISLWKAVTEILIEMCRINPLF